MKKTILISSAVGVAGAVMGALPAGAAPLNWHQAFYSTQANCLRGAQILRADGARVGTLPGGHTCGRYNGQWYLNYAYPS